MFPPPVILSRVAVRDVICSSRAAEPIDSPPSVTFFGLAAGGELRQKRQGFRQQDGQGEREHRTVTLQLKLKLDMKLNLDMKLKLGMKLKLVHEVEVGT